MQKASNTISKKIVEVNENNMKEICENLKLVNHVRGMPENIIDIEGDGMYSSSIYSGISNTPFQPAKQCVYVQTENETCKKRIIAVATKNKLCSKHGLDLDSKHKCATNSQCSANIPITKSIGDEHQWAKECLQKLNDYGLEVGNLTTDPDSSAYRAAKSLAMERKSKTEPCHLIDTRHLSQNHRKYVKKSPDVLSMMPGRTKYDREQIRNRFACDIAKRCHAEYVAAFDKYSVIENEVYCKLSYTCDAIIDCYQGKHALCRKHSLVCCSPKGNWIKRSPFLKEDFVINQTSSNRSILRDCVNYRLGKQILLRTKLNSNTQKTESTNRTIRRSLPKNTTFKRNFSGRVHSAVHFRNNGPQKSITDLCDAAGCPIISGSKVAKTLARDQKTYQYQKLYQSSHRRKQLKSLKRLKLYQLYEKQSKQKSDYQSGKLLKSRKFVSEQTSTSDHSYCKKLK